MSQTDCQSADCRCVDCMPSCIGKCECQETKDYIQQSVDLSMVKRKVIRKKKAGTRTSSFGGGDIPTATSVQNSLANTQKHYSATAPGRTNSLRKILLRYLLQQNFLAVAVNHDFSFDGWLSFRIR